MLHHDIAEKPLLGVDLQVTDCILSYHAFPLLNTPMTCKPATLLT
jgi:hypothetical protein